MAESDPQQQQQPDAGAPQGDDAQGADVEQALDSAQSSLDQVKDAVDQGDDAAPRYGSGEDDTTMMPEAGRRGHNAPPPGIELLGDVDLDVTIELGRTEMLVEDVLRLTSGSVVELDKLAGDPVDVYVNGRLVARGEVLVLNDNFCIRISEIVANLEEEAEAAAQEGQQQTQQRAEWQQQTSQAAAGAGGGNDG